MDMVEKVARALYAIRMEVAEGTGIHEPYSWETDNNAYREHCLREARAAIEAMREPTEAMLERLSYFGMLDGDAEEAWAGAIDGALKPDEADWKDLSPLFTPSPASK